MTSKDAERGAAAVEFALVVPILLLLVFGIVDFGMMLNRDTMVNNASRDGVRAASLGATSTEVKSIVATNLGVPLNEVSTTVTCTKPDGSACTTYDAQSVSGGIAVVTVTFEHSFITPITSMFGDVTLSKTSKMRIE
jgi:Flp pilus assembly protein TadG